MKILHLRTLAHTGGGPEKTIFNSCKAFAQKNIQADALYIVNPKSTNIKNLSQLAKNAGIRLFVIEETNPLSLKTFRTMQTILSDQQYDIVHSHDYKTHLLAAILRRKFGYKYIATVHGYNATTLREKIYYQFDRFSLRRANLVIAPAKFLADELKRKFKINNIEVVYNGIELNEYPFAEFDKAKFTAPFNLLYLGRLSAEKNVKLLIEAIALLSERGFNLRLKIAGAGPQEKYLKRLVEVKGLNHCIEFTGFLERTKIHELLSSADIFVLPSKTEVFPNVLLEAMAVGTPVIATKVGGVEELIRDETDGLLVNSDDVNQLTQKIEFLINHPELACNFAVSARKRIEQHFTFANHFVRTIEIYEEL